MISGQCVVSTRALSASGTHSGLLPTTVQGGARASDRNAGTALEALLERQACTSGAEALLQPSAWRRPGWGRRTGHLDPVEDYVSEPSSEEGVSPSEQRPTPFGRGAEAQGQSLGGGFLDGSTSVAGASAAGELISTPQKKLFACARRQAFLASLTTTEGASLNSAFARRRGDDLTGAGTLSGGNSWEIIDRGASGIKGGGGSGDGGSGDGRNSGVWRQSVRRHTTTAVPVLGPARERHTVQQLGCEEDLRCEEGLGCEEDLGRGLGERESTSFGSPSKRDCQATPQAFSPSSSGGLTGSQVGFLEVGAKQDLFCTAWSTIMPV